jgi:hypothetical protein
MPLTHAAVPRCKVLPDTDSALCHHCRQYGSKRTLFLPITGTRFRKRIEEEAAAAGCTRNKSKQRGLSYAVDRDVCFWCVCAPMRADQDPP